MGQTWERRSVDEGLRLYGQGEYEAAVKQWKRALHRVRSRNVRFATLGYLATAHGDCGKLRDMLSYAVLQVELAQEGGDKDEDLLSQAFLSMSQSHQRLAEYHKAVYYARQSLRHQPRLQSIHGYAYLTQGSAYLGFSNFRRALENFEAAMTLARSADDLALEIQVYSALGQTFTVLKDYEKGRGFMEKAVEFAAAVQGDDLARKFRRVTLVGLAEPYAKLQRFASSSKLCEEALQLATEDGDKPTQAKCRQVMGDVFLSTGELEKAMSNYNYALNLFSSIGDRRNQLDVLVGLAKSSERMRIIGKALEYENTALELASSIGAKAVRCHARLVRLCRTTGALLMAEEHDGHWRQLVADMDLYCGHCNQLIAHLPDSIEPLTCFHIVHARCKTATLQVSDVECKKCSTSPGNTSSL